MHLYFIRKTVLFIAASLYFQIEILQEGALVQDREFEQQPEQPRPALMK